MLDHKSECAVSPIEPYGGYKVGDPDRGCWHPKTFKKAVIIIIDALRYDFTVPFQATKDDEAPHHFHNAIPVFYETAVANPNKAFLLPFIADAPTATLQRLKGLTTGTLPTFVDAGSNFAGTAIDEDNIIAQLKTAGKKIVHLGDDTWHALFPGYFEPNLTHAYDSFNVWDLHTVDNGVNEHIFPLLEGDSKSWDVAIGHYLGVDHAGHRYGPDHSAMASKLKQMDEAIRKMIASIDDETLLVIMGDHGMDSKGDHGGESDDEIEAALWMYAKKGVFGQAEALSPPATAKERAVAQIDLVPTLSLLLGLPIPFNNLGAPITEAFIGPKGADYKNLAVVNRLAAAQIHRYQQEYANAQSSQDPMFSSPLAMWPKVDKIWENTEKNAKTAGNKLLWKNAWAAFQGYQKQTLIVCKNLWARFDVPSMVQGILTLAMSLGILIVYARGIKSDVIEFTPALLARGGSGTVVGGIVGYAVQTLLPNLEFGKPAAFLAVIGGGVGVTSALSYGRRLLRLPWPTQTWSWVCVHLPLLMTIGFASNSYTIWEDEILLVIIATFGVMMLGSSLRQENAINRALGSYHSILFILLTRLSSLSRLCREEQMPHCKSTYYSSATSSTSAGYQLFIPITIALLLPVFIKNYYTGTKSYHNTAPIWIGFAFRIGLILSALYWALDAADDGDWLDVPKGVLKTTKVIIARVVLGIAFGGGYSLYAWSPPLLKIETRTKPRGSASTSTEGVVAESSANSIVVLGYSNVHGTRYALLLPIWSLAAILVSKPMGQGSIAILTWQIFSLLEIIDTNDLSATAVGPTLLALLGSYHFFKTGHQATLSSIQWESAFIPLHAIRYPWSPLLVVLNTFGAQILTVMAVPATVLWKQAPKKKGLLANVATAMATHLAIYALFALGTMCWAGWLRRHLMLFRIFSPRFMTAAAVLGVVDVVGVLVALGGVRWSFQSVAEVFGWN